MSNGERIAATTFWRLLSLATFAAGYWVFTAIWHANPVWAAGASAVMALSDIPNWARS